jgi:predicted lipid carrier protein YhbT
VGRGRGPGPSVAVQVVVSGGSAGDVTAHLTLADGVVVEASVGEAAEPDIAFTAVAADAVAIANGDLDPSVAFMQGRLKTTGDPGRVLELLAFVRACTHTK